MQDDIIEEIEDDNEIEEIAEEEAVRLLIDQLSEGRYSNDHLASIYSFVMGGNGVRIVDVNGEVSGSYRDGEVIL
jgi:hypothetical protein